MAATEFPTARLFSWFLALALTVSTAAAEDASPQASKKKLKASASGTLVLVTTTEKQPARIEQAAHQEQPAAVKMATPQKRISKTKNKPASVTPKRRTNTAKAKQPTKKISQADQIAHMLVHAHQLSKQAADEKEFEEIAVICSTAERLGAKGDQLEFALQLHLWASKQRDSIRMTQLEQQLKEDKVTQQVQTQEKLQTLRAELTKQRLRAQQAEQKLEAEQLARKLRSERIADQRETAQVVKELREEISGLKQRAEQAEEALAQQRLQPLEPEPLDVFADEAEQVQTLPPVALAATSTPQPIQAVISEPTDSVEQSVDWHTLHDEAVTLAEQGRFVQAMKTFNRVIEVNPMFAKAYSNRATLHVQQGNFELAAKDYEQACTIDGDFLHALIGLGRTYHQLGKLAEALECMNRCIEIDAENAELFCTRADLHADMANYREALADYAQTIDLAPEFAHAYRNGAWLLATCPDPRYRDPQNAIQGAQQAIEFNYGDRHVALDTLAAAFASDGQFDQATRTMQQALQIAPNEVVKDYRERLAAYKSQESFFPIKELEEDVQMVTFEVSDR